jgi:hypothetical protein
VVLAATLALVLAVTVVPVMPELAAAPLVVLLVAVVPQAILAHLAATVVHHLHSVTVAQAVQAV